MSEESKQQRTMSPEDECWIKVHNTILEMVKENPAKSKYINGWNDALLDVMLMCSDNIGGSND